MYNSNDYVVFSTMEAFVHVHGVADLGKVFPKDASREDLDASGSFARLHSNGDLFTWIDGKWKRVNLEEVDFVPRTN
jgi:hypothetical protein